jgi:hypothetical protein
MLTSFSLKVKLFNNCGGHKCLLLTLRIIILKIVGYFTLLDQHPTLSKLTKPHMKNQHTNVCYKNPSSKHNLKTQKNHDVSQNTKDVNLKPHQEDKPLKHENVHIESSFNKKSTQLQETNV